MASAFKSSCCSGRRPGQLTTPYLSKGSEALFWPPGLYRDQASLHKMNKAFLIKNNINEKLFVFIMPLLFMCGPACLYVHMQAAAPVGQKTACEAGL